MTTQIKELPQTIATEMKRTGVWRDDCPVALERLLLLEVQYFGFDGRHHQDGLLVVLDAAATRIAALFDTLFARQFPIAKMRLMQEYGGDDALALADNNTSCFNHRNIAGRDLISLHSYGLALDINPRENPCLTVGENDQVSVQGSTKYLNRNLTLPGMIEPVVPVVIECGLSAWGGNWTNPIDYQHFQFPRALVAVFDRLSKENARLFYDAAANNPSLTARDKEEVDRLLAESRDEQHLLERLLSSR